LTLAQGWPILINILLVGRWNISGAVSRMMRLARVRPVRAAPGACVPRGKEAGMTTTGTGSPTAVRRELGQRLRGLRLDRDLTVAEVASRVGFSQSRLTKIELGQGAKRDDVVMLLDVYEETDPQQQASLLAMVRAGASKEWWEGRRALPPKFGSYLGLESVAATLQAYDTTLVHGLLQTPDYARALLRAERPELLAHEIDQLVDLRMRRQEILTRAAAPPPPTLWSVMDEAVLRRQVGGQETMHAQLQRLIERSELPNVTLLVMPDDLGAHAGLDGPFSILQFETGARPVVYVECQAGNLYLEKDDDLRRCQQTMNHILAAAPGPEPSLALIRQAAKEMKP
jgi:transcriptional regulator with XRE-family HTH domain